MHDRQNPDTANGLTPLDIAHKSPDHTDNSGEKDAKTIACGLFLPITEVIP